jgi:uncharacterized membrane protein
MPMIHTAAALPAVGAAFAASLVEVVEAFTIVLAVGTTRGWRAAWLGTLAALATLAAGIATTGPALQQIPIRWLQLGVGVLLLLFGLGWLRKASLRAGGVIALRDEAALFARASSEMTQSSAHPSLSEQWIGGIAVFKAVLLEGLEVAFIVVAVGAGQGLLGAAAIGALAACVVVLAIGVAVHRPLARVPENTLKFGVGVMLSAFGVFWAGEGLGIGWPGGELALPALALLFLLAGWSAAVMLRTSRPVGATA